MDIKDFLSPGDCMVDVQASEKSQLLMNLSAQAASKLKLDAKMIAAEILNREAIGSTGMGEGMSLPHARIQGLKGPFGLLATLAQPIDFNAVDGKPVDVVFLLLLPVSSKREQLNALACVARKLRDAGTLRGLRAAANSAELFRAMTKEARE